LLNERLVKDDVYTSIHIDEFDVEIRETKLGREEFTRDIPNVSEKALRNLDENGIVRSARGSARATSWSARSAPRARVS
jgi:DNA-directed RNA polymerase subunit beta